VGGACSTHERGEKIGQDLIGKPEGKRPLGRSMRRWDQMDLREVGWGGGVDLTGLG
jgi:hypothetical protein